MDLSMSRASEPGVPASSALVRRAYRRQLLIGALALAMLAFATLVLLVEVQLNEEVEARYQQAISIALQSLDAHHLDSVSASVSARARQATEHSRFLNLIARYTLALVTLLAVSFGSVFGVLMWRAPTAGRGGLGALGRVGRRAGATRASSRRGRDD